MDLTRFGPVGVVLAAVAVAAVLTGCQKGGSAGGAPASPVTEAPTSRAPVTGTPTGEPAEEPVVKPAVKPAKPAVKSSEPPASAAEKPAAEAGCVTAPPAPEAWDPDEFALYRIEELPAGTGKVNLVLRNGAWGCGAADSDGGPFVVSGEESRWAMDQAAYVTATDPIVASTENQRIGVQELIDWVKAHPDSGLVFRYERGDDGAIHRLDQVFVP
ncbi:hypothetical protein ACH414_14430 [Streptomyces sp. NPDC020422]|uniref:hypothetical protein n=1 Tax=Streptomyces sp. NPDC020422 TaxID=3365074 RepID=UPI00378D7617